MALYTNSKRNRIGKPFVRFPELNCRLGGWVENYTLRVQHINVKRSSIDLGNCVTHLRKQRSTHTVFHQTKLS